MKLINGIAIAIISAGVVALTGCNTVQGTMQGMGKDMKTLTTTSSTAQPMDSKKKKKQMQMQQQQNNM